MASLVEHIGFLTLVPFLSHQSSNRLRD